MMINPFRDKEDLLTLGELARRIATSPYTVRHWRNAGTLPVTRIGGRVYITREQWEAFIAACNNRPAYQRESDGAALCDAMGL